METSQSYRMRWWLFIIFTSLFALAYLLTIGALFFGLGELDPSTLERFGSVFIVETAVAVIALFYSLFALRGASGDAAAPTLVQDVAGFWWQYIHDFPGKAVSIVEIRYSPHEKQVQLSGETYNERGERAARWNSTAAGINQASFELFYFWRGDHYAKRNRAFSGIGTFHFRPFEESGVQESAAGWYTTGDLHDASVASAMVKVELCRMKDDDRRTLASADPRERAELIERRSREWAEAFGLSELPTPGDWQRNLDSG